MKGPISYPACALTGYYALRANCYTPLPGAAGVVLQSRERERSARARSEIAATFLLHNFGAIHARVRFGRSGRARAEVACRWLAYHWG